MGLLDLCEKYYDTRNLYEVLQIAEKASDKDVKKAYHKLSLKVHPDRVPEDQKLVATEKFKVLGSIHSILTDTQKRATYDETKCVDDDDSYISDDKDWSVYWRLLFKKITDEDIKAYEKEYIGSEEEKKDLKRAYLNGKGDMDYIVDDVQFARSEHEERLKKILHEMINNGEIPPYKIFTHEPAKKHQKRLNRENREAKEAEELQDKLGLNSGVNSLEMMIKQKQEARAQQMDSYIDELAAKYGGSNKRKATKRKAATKVEGKEQRTSKRRK